MDQCQKINHGLARRLLFLKQFNSNNYQSTSNQNQSSRNLSGSNKIPKSLNAHLELLSNTEVSPIPYQAAAKFPQIPENTLNQAYFLSLASEDFITINVPDSYFYVNQIEIQEQSNYNSNKRNDYKVEYLI